MTNRVFSLVAAAAVSAVLFTTFAPAGAAAPADQVKARQQLMKRMGSGMEATGKFLKGEGATADDVKRGAAAIAEVASHDPSAVFPQGTAAPLADSATRPELWQEWPRAQQIWSELKPATERLNAAAATGDRQQIAQAQQAVGKVCSSCHENFRIKKN